MSGSATFSHIELATAKRCALLFFAREKWLFPKKVLVANSKIELEP
jgi:hypothetical protein